MSWSGRTRSGLPGRPVVIDVCLTPICRTSLRTRSSGFVPLVWTRRIRSDTSGVGLSIRGLWGTQSTYLLSLVRSTQKGAHPRHGWGHDYSLRMADSAARPNTSAADVAAALITAGVAIIERLEPECLVDALFVEM